MANQKNKQGNQPGSAEDKQDFKQNNVTEFNPQTSRGGTSSFDTGGASTASQGGGSGMSGTTSGTSGTGGSTTGVSGTGGSTTGTGTGMSGTGMGAASGGGSGAATATARSFVDQAKETASQAYEAVTDKAATKLDEQKTTLSGGLTTVADSIRQVSENLGSSRTDSGLAEAAAKYTNTAALRLQDVAGYFERKNVRDMARDLEGYARRNPAMFLGAAFGLGLLAARFLKSTPTGYDQTGNRREFPSAGIDHQLNAPSTQPNTTNFGAKPM